LGCLNKGKGKKKGGRRGGSVKKKGSVARKYLCEKREKERGESRDLAVYWTIEEKGERKRVEKLGKKKKRLCCLDWSERREGGKGEKLVFRLHARKKKELLRREPGPHCGTFRRQRKKRKREDAKYLIRDKGKWA